MQESQKEMIKVCEEMKDKLQKAKVFAKIQEEEKNKALKKNQARLKVKNITFKN